jgi:hypothetical protein
VSFGGTSVKVKYIAGDDLAKFIKRHGYPYPERTYMHPGAMAQYGVVTIGDTRYHFPTYEALEYQSLEKTNKLSEKLDKLFADMREKKDPDEV